MAFERQSSRHGVRRGRRPPRPRRHPIEAFESLLPVDLPAVDVESEPAEADTTVDGSSPDTTTELQAGVAADGLIDAVGDLMDGVGSLGDTVEDVIGGVETVVEEAIPDLPDVDALVPVVEELLAEQLIPENLIPDVLIPDVLIPDVLVPDDLIPEDLGPDPVGDQPAAEPTLVAQWNELALQAIREDKPVPTVITRSLHLAHAAMYDAWAAFDDNAAGAYFNPRRQRRRRGRPAPQEAIERAVSRAAYSSLSALFPDHQDRFDALLDELGHNNRRHAASRLGARAARTVLGARAADGANAAGNYADTSGYQPRNAPDADNLDPNAWTPLKVPNGSVLDDNGIPLVTDDPASYEVQTPLTPHWGGVQPFALARGDVYRPVAPPQLGDFSPYTDAEGVVSTNDAAYRSQFSEVAALSAGLTAEQKVIAEYWADGPQSSTPPGHWNEFAHDIALREDHGLEQDVKFFFALNNALFDTGIAIWDAKYFHDYVRPQTAIRYLFADEEIEAWGGPNQGTQLIPGSTWQPYQDVTFVTPAFPEYTSGHSGFSFAAATVVEAFTGSDVLYDGFSTGAQDFDGDGEADLIGSWTTDALAFESYQGDPITLQWGTVWEAAAEAGRSRLYGGIHIQDGDLRARVMGQQVAEQVWDHTETLFTAEDNRPLPRPRRPRRRQASPALISADSNQRDADIVSAVDALNAFDSAQIV